ncbi:polysaccharide biosynthesis C-terminal domain-containing protein, partial [Escherichia coli]|nr:polysaccharide biosynthesis C-terminal domain-containing protein [Escherichia coli]
AQIFRARRRTDVIFRAFAVSFAVSLALIQPLITRYGATGAAAVVALAHGASLLALLAALGRAGVPKSPAPRSPVR